MNRCSIASSRPAMSDRSAIGAQVIILTGIELFSAYSLEETWREKKGHEMMARSMALNDLRYLAFGRPTGGMTVRQKPKSCCLLLKIHEMGIGVTESQIPGMYFGVCS
jgi:hypothetical protein